MSVVPARATPYRRWNPEQVRSIPADRFFVIQFDDADKVSVGGYMEDTTQRRRLPGQGAFDLIGFIQMLDEIGVNAAVSVEILSDEQGARTLEDAARLAHDTTLAYSTGRAGDAQIPDAAELTGGYDGQIRLSDRIPQPKRAIEAWRYRFL